MPDSCSTGSIIRDSVPKDCMTNLFSHGRVLPLSQLCRPGVSRRSKGSELWVALWDADSSRQYELKALSPCGPILALKTSRTPL